MFVVSGYLAELVKFILPVISSPVFLAAIVAPFIGFHIFLKQQRLSRIQKLYYEDSLISVLNHLDETIDITSKNITLFENAVNIMRNHLNGVMMPIHDPREQISEITSHITAPIAFRSSKREVIITLFGEKGYVLHQWITKYDNDFRSFNLFVGECLAFLDEQIRNRQLALDNVMDIVRQVEGYHQLIMKHYNLPVFFNKIASIAGDLDFKSKEKLSKALLKNKVISNILNKADETFKTSFGYYQIADDTFISYLQDENGRRYRLQLNATPRISPAEEDNSLNESQLIILMNDRTLINERVVIDDRDINYSRIQTGIANMRAFDERPKFYREVHN